MPAPDSQIERITEQMRSAAALNRSIEACTGCLIDLGEAELLALASNDGSNAFGFASEIDLVSSLTEAW